MFTLFYDGGAFMWPLLLLAITVISLSVKKSLELYGTKEQNLARLEVGLNAIIFWGGISVIVGFLGSFIGIYLAASYVPSSAEPISTGIVWGGIRVALITTIFGLIIFTYSSIAWFILRNRFIKLIGKTV